MRYSPRERGTRTGDAVKFEEVLEAEAHLLGRVTYESFAGAWPTQTGEFADKGQPHAEHVVLTTLTDLGWEKRHLIDREVPEQVAHDLVYGWSAQ